MTLTSRQWPVLHFSQQMSITVWQLERQLLKLFEKNSFTPAFSRKSTGSPPKCSSCERFCSRFKSFAFFTEGRSVWRIKRPLFSLIDISTRLIRKGSGNGEFNQRFISRPKVGHVWDIRCLTVPVLSADGQHGVPLHPLFPPLIFSIFKLSN